MQFDAFLKTMGTASAQRTHTLPPFRLRTFLLVYLRQIGADVTDNSRTTDRHRCYVVSCPSLHTRPSRFLPYRAQLFTIACPRLSFPDPST